MGDELPVFESVAYALTDLWIADDFENPTTVFLNNGEGYADDNSKSPELIVCTCTTEPRRGQYCWVTGTNAEGEHLYPARLQYLGADAHGQWFQYQR